MAQKIYVVGIGPGAAEDMTGRAAAALSASDVIAGYQTYIDLVRPAYPDKEYISNGMTKEVDRCRLALETAKGGKTVALISSGDAGVYGMAGLMYQVATGSGVEIEVVAGITAACSGAALLGAPLVHDFCLISLSDLLTPWEAIEKRLDRAADADFVIVLYNPGSHKRADYLQKACEIIGKYRAAATPAGLVRNIGRDGSTAEITTLGDLAGCQADMLTTVFIGNSQTEVIDGRMVTPRGYRLV
ncbi:precorrin-3B C(17)-methyltransferase [Megasphaera hominis]|jgi:precorrin-3B C17-methyltransferase|uniref:Precorrin-3B C(17)-methyltransferase n=1 Tax=Megasphaera hominis TaxID=159836 RepID=A0ABR6VI76_9FIRM|nr:precorrin-3B C(17)-methyltransferase [Megasphaera hominis]MBC3536914.1 precorrin-3B C(17)-methyltransferase [Megasphaera hominis]